MLFGWIKSAFSWQTRVDTANLEGKLTTGDAKMGSSQSLTNWTDANSCGGISTCREDVTHHSPLLIKK